MDFPEGNWADPAMPDRALRAIRAQAETEAQSLLFGLAHSAYAQAAAAHYGPEYDQKRARLVELEAQRELAFEAWQEARATAQAASEAVDRAQEARDYGEQVAQLQRHDAASQESVELAKQLNALDKELGPLRQEVQHASAFLSALRAVERPAMPSWFVDAVRQAARRGTGSML
jgi:hypothetical protein